MYKFMVRCPIAMTEEDLVDHLVYSGADSYSWWHTIAITDTGELLLEADDPSDIDGELPPIGKMMALSDVAEEIQMILDNPNTNKNIISAFANDDVDSDVADMILQTLLFGKIIFG